MQTRERTTDKGTEKGWSIRVVKIVLIRYLNDIEKVIAARAHLEEELLIKEIDVKERRVNAKLVNELEMQKQERMVDDGTEADACLDSTKFSSSGDDLSAKGAQISKGASETDNVIAGASHEKVHLTRCLKVSLL
uniref:Uncharacterized protein n=1 Tax=Tanacetum cinerariifolium TaxID=118510 RepID=A0A6L2M649_TANCI|nr:hypothetical protein [Tanacetum cinerariifolium]